MRGFIGDIPFGGGPVCHGIATVAEQDHRPSVVFCNSIPEYGLAIIDLPDKTVFLAYLYIVDQ